MMPDLSTSGPVLAVEALIGDREFERLRTLIQREAGIFIVPAKRTLVVGRLLKRVRELGLRSFGEYCARVEGDAGERVQMLDRIATNETHFFREPRHFELLAHEILPRWQAEARAGLRPRRVHAWSAACSTGEEPYTLAMTLLRAFPNASGWDLDILASDISTRALQRAREAVWPISRADNIPPVDLRRFMLRGVGAQEGLMRASPALRALVRFVRINLVEAAAGVGTMDLIFCRNVLIYFDAATGDEVVARLASHLAPGGYLFLGHAESLARSSAPLRSVAPNVYRRDERSSPGA
jgi:chemotaxis protein methyltransferase CheR